MRERDSIAAGDGWGLRSIKAGRLSVSGGLFKICDKAIPAARDGFNKQGLARIVAERLPQLLNVKGQVGLVNKRVRPEPVHQRFLLNNAAAVFDQNQQSIKDLRGQRQRGAVAKKHPLFAVNGEFSEVIQLADRLRHLRLELS